MVACLVWDQEAGGSSPPSPTMLRKNHKLIKYLRISRSKSSYLVNSLRFVLKKLGIAVIEIDSLQILQDGSHKSANFDFLSILNTDNVGEILKIWGKSKSQIRQDLFVLSELNLNEFV